MSDEPDTGEEVPTEDPYADLEHSMDGTPLDPEDGMPIFGELDGVPMSRKRYLEATRPEREAEQLEQMEALVEKNTDRRGGDSDATTKKQTAASRRKTTSEEG
jgi:hypothetical protein